MSEISKAYEPKSVEAGWYRRWLDAGCFTADPASAKPGYSIVIPPPNVTGVLHIGHVLNNTLQDILARRARMTGHEVLWLPGSDHAGIATQTVVERALRKSEGKTRHDLGRDAFVGRIWEWKEKHGNIIFSQLRSLGCSLDWSRERFTMDGGYSRRVAAVFVDLFEKGFIYRGMRMVNWCPVSLTALSDEEVVSKAQKGFLYHFQVEVIERPGTYLEIATTRPETIMGDSGVAVNPNDPRYKEFIGLHVRRPLPRENQAHLPIVGDEAVDFEFGTGVLKVTPAHDRTDFEIGARHGLEVIDIFNPNGTLNGLAGDAFVGLDRFEARVAAVEKLREDGVLLKEEPYENNVGFSERADVPVEPRLSEQWFLRYPRVEESREAVRNGDIRFFPERWSKVFDGWLDNIQDWCISRQLWWGHRIPVWYRDGEMRCQIDSPGDGWEQDPDVLDTWFSSWLWPFATMDDSTRAKFYPTSALVTGWDILFFWVARMIMAGFEYEERIPFRDVFFTGMIRDRQGRKMSKSLGNSPDPLDLIAKYGADGLRFGLLRIAPQGADIRFDEKQIEEGRNFGNKLWNACRFREMQGPSEPRPTLEGKQPTVFCLDILGKLDALVSRIETGYENYRFHEICQSLYEFFWSDYCDWFVEASKPVIAGDDPAAREATLATMDVVLHTFLRLLHPFMPHISEELWSRLGFTAHYHGKEFLLFAAWPGSPVPDFIPRAAIGDAMKRTAALYQSVSIARNLRAEYRIPSNKKVRLVLRPGARSVEGDSVTFAGLAGASECLVDPDFVPEKGTPAAVAPLGQIFMPLSGLVDPAAERDRLEKEIGKARSELEKVRKKLENASFVDHAPTEVVEEHRRRACDFSDRLEQLDKMRAALD